MDIKQATFKGGIHPSYNKHYTEKLPIETMPAPKEVVLPMSMHIGAPCTPVVEVGAGCGFCIREHPRQRFRQGEGD